MRVLRGTAGRVRERREGAESVLASGERELRVPSPVIDALVRGGALRRTGEGLERTEAGVSVLRRLLADPSGDGHAEQHRARTAETIERDGVPETVARNVLESPLDRLAASRDRDGAPFLPPALAEAGRRLRADFERGQLRSRTTMAWEAPASTGTGASGSDRTTLTDAAMAARERYARAIEALGPRLGPALADFVALEIGLADVEKGRGWPVRSGKMLLREALDRLAAHYAAHDRAAHDRAR